MMVGAEIGEVKAAAGRATGVPRLVVRDLALEPDDPHGVRLQGDLARSAGRRDRRHRRRLRQRPGRIVRGAVGRTAFAGGRQRGDRRHRGRHHVDHRTASPRRRLRAGGATRPRHRAAHEAVRQCAAHRACGERHGAIAASSIAPPCSIRWTAPPRSSTCARPSATRRRCSLSGGNLQKFVVGREILREPGVLVVAQPTWGVDAGAAAVIRQALIDLAAPRRRGAGGQPGSRRARGDRRPHRRDLPRPPVAGDRCGDGDPGIAGSADGRSAQGAGEEVGHALGS